MIGYEMGSSPTMIYTMAKTSPMTNFKHEWKCDMVVNMARHFTRRISLEVKYVRQPQTLRQENLPPHNSR
jgi:hypothetical protein